MKEQKGSVLEKKDIKLKSNKDLKKYYSKKWKNREYEKGYVLNGIEFSKRYDKERKSRSFRFLKPKKDDIILDAGCGKGDLSLKISKKAKKVYAIDLTKEGFKEIKKKSPKNLIFKEMNLEKLDFKDKFFDKIVCVETLEHVLRPEKVLKEFHRVLKNRGYLVLTYPFLNKTNIAKTEQFLKIRKFNNIAEHLNEWDYNELKKKLNKRGFDIIEQDSFAFDWGKLLWRAKYFSKNLTKFLFEKGIKINNKPNNSFFVILKLQKRE